jgi:hypothetical protein
MKINQISKPVTAKSLNESLAKKFGTRVALEKFSLEQLEDARNKLRTQLHQVETTESFNSVQSESYQKSKLLLDVLNAEITERSSVEEKAVSKAQQKAAGAALAAKRGDAPKSELDDASKEMMKMSMKDLEKFAGTKHKGMPEKKTEGIVKEGAEEQAEIVMASKNMVDKITGWLEDTAEMQTESMLELADAIRDEMGSEKSEAFVNTVRPALEALYSALEETRTSMSNSLGVLTGEQEAADMMGDDEPEMEPTDDMEADAAADVEPEDAVDVDDEFATDDAAAGGDEEAGRPRRESIEFSRKLGTLLSSKKK